MPRMTKAELAEHSAAIRELRRKAVKAKTKRLAAKNKRRVPVNKTAEPEDDA